ncbi:hypothetical protein ICN48_13560 [Polynucleobacter sp. JS-Safj-400b-B2]|uniref:hypothetical protein n=1 Tax=Polynucleobacter sp. JS-Safj-400b-B2 TaxID=2576921 RepID=UPI001C0D9F14|nr:hypothetical protein [Polynucleobacter sp. JS-Safj-400b-B2]MBU3627253.1 hypothetical protein [Polynucleobacter sp. JS-Safj-400b-B2]
MLPTEALELVYQDAVPQTVFGLVIMSLVLIFDGIGFVGTMLFFKANIGSSPHPSRLKATFFFVLCIQMLALTQLTSMCIWAGALLIVGICPNWLTALRLSASSYTTLGNFTYTLPGGWHLVPSFIAFSGLFSFAWASSSTITMVGILNKYLDTSKNSTPQSNF